MTKVRVDKNKLEILLNYLSDEKRHWEESGKPKKHIWMYIKHLLKEAGLNG